MHTIVANQTDRRLDQWLAEHPDLPSRRKGQEAIERGKVVVDDVVVREPGYKVPVGATIVYDPRRKGTSVAQHRGRELLVQAGVQIVFEDDHLLVLNKPAGMLTDTATHQQARAGNSLRHLATDYLRPQDKLAWVAHRIDRDTSGLVLFAKTEELSLKLREQFEAHTPERVYWALVQGVIEAKSGTWEHWMAWNAGRRHQLPSAPGKPHAALGVAHWRVLGRYPTFTAIEVKLHTGKRNQIRLQAQLVGHPLVGETQYLPEEHKPCSPRAKRQALHAQRLAFDHPVTGARLSFEASLPDELSKLTRARPGRSYPRDPVP